MIKRYIGAAINIIFALAILFIFMSKPMNALGLLAMITMFICIGAGIYDISVISGFNNNGKNRKIVLKYSDFIKYLNIAPHKYNLNSNFVYYMEGQYIHTIIYFDSLISDIRYWMNKGGMLSNNYMEQYLEKVSKDIEDYRKDSERKVEEALKSQKSILNRMNKEKNDVKTL